MPRLPRHQPFGYSEEEFARPADSNDALLPAELTVSVSESTRMRAAEELRENAWQFAVEVSSEMDLHETTPSEAVGQIPAFLGALAHVLVRNPNSGTPFLSGAPVIDPLLSAAASAHADQRIASRATARDVLEEFAALRRALARHALDDPERTLLHVTMIDPILDQVMGEVVDQFHGIATRELRFRAERDPLTGLLNRSAFVERLERELAHAQRHDRRLTLVALDLDAFKHVNDTLGHLTGDAVLRRIAELLETHTREHDLVARIGGDEFVVALTEADADAARNLVRRVRIHLAPTRRQLDLPAAFGVSYGTATFPADGSSIDALFSQADSGMYRDKDPSRAQNAPTPAHTADGAEVVTPDAKVHVLVADDDSLMRELCRETLEASGFAVTLAASGEAALAAAEESVPDAIVMDVRMPTMSGWDVVDQLSLNKRTTDVPVIMLTGLTDGESLSRADSAGVSDYVAKPFAPLQLTEAVHRVLEMSGERERELQLRDRRTVARGA